MIWPFIHTLGLEYVISAQLSNTLLNVNKPLRQNLAQTEEDMYIQYV